MDIDTSSLSAARRNLVVISMGFILFALGGATLSKIGGESSISILAVKITFSNPDILIKFAWIMFGWFLLRFWQFSKHLDDFQQYSIAMYYSKLMLRWFVKNGRKANSRYNGSTLRSVFGDWTWPAVGGDFVISKWEIHKKLFIFLYVAITTEHFGQYYFPYCLAITALIITLVN